MTLSEAADALFDVGRMSAEFFEHEEGFCDRESGAELRVATVFEFICTQAGAVRWRAIAGEMQTAADEWCCTPIVARLRECKRIADTVEASE